MPKEEKFTLVKACGWLKLVQADISSPIKVTYILSKNWILRKDYISFLVKNKTNFLETRKTFFLKFTFVCSEYMSWHVSL